MTQRQVFLSGGALIAAVLIGFFASHGGHAVRVAGAQDVAADSSPALPATIAVSAGALSNMQLHYANAALRPLLRDVPATGIVTYNALRLADIVPPARGRVEAIDAVVGEQVQAGQRLAVLDNFDLSAARSGVASAQASVMQAQSQLEAATAALQRAEDLVRSGGMAQSELDMRRASAAAAQATLRTQQSSLQQWQDHLAQLLPINPGSAPAPTGLPDPRDSAGAIVAPFAGVVDSVTLSTGQTVDPSQPVFTVADLSTVWVPLQVPEDQIGAVQVGDTVALTVDAYPGRTFTGRVAYIADKVDPNTGTIMVRCIVPNQDGALRVNMFANGMIQAPLGRQAVLVPASALQNINGQEAVFSPTGHGNFAWHAVQPGISSGGSTQILSGIAPGTPIVTNGSYWLKATLMQTTIPDEG
ncbi:efflux RND transporter periplasmic adaptor subunit [Acidocella sp.]|jgi:cobalt-zinc-cadmium efflux system membrane fusion protein|uniref:efflux RND transporter periplasmic adaptor subunit n=1 Tax=Acidocella sp. TaxID=50710 RepID=UPI002F3F2EB6